MHRAINSIALTFLLGASSAFAGTGNEAKFDSKANDSVQADDSTRSASPDVADHCASMARRASAHDSAGAVEDANYVIQHANPAISLERTYLKAAYLVGGLANQVLGKDADAITNFRSLIVLAPEMAAHSFILIGMSQMKVGQWEDAFHSYDEAINRNSNLAIAYSGRGLTQMHAGRLDDALADLDKAVSLEKSDVRIWATRGAVHLVRKEPELAIADLEMALSLPANEKQRLEIEGDIARAKQLQR